MMASHGRGQQVDWFQAMILGGVALVALGLGGGPGVAEACHIRHKVKSATSTPATTTPTVASAQVLTPTSLVPAAPPLTPSTASLPTVTPTATVPAATSSADVLTPTPLTNPPAAEQITPPTVPPAVAVWHDAVPTASAPCGCPPPPVCATPIPSAPVTAGEGVTPPAPTLPPSASDTVATPEPSTIVSALVMLGAAVVYRRRNRTGA